MGNHHPTRMMMITLKCIGDQISMVREEHVCYLGSMKSAPLAKQTIHFMLLEGLYPQPKKLKFRPLPETSAEIAKLFGSRESARTEKFEELLKAQRLRLVPTKVESEPST